MNKFLISILFMLAFYFESRAQVEDTNLYTVVQQMPSYPEGRDSLFAFIDRNLERPEGYIDAMVIIHFIVRSNGKLTDFKIAKSVDPTMDSAAMRCIHKLPSWSPGMQNGHATNVEYMLPFRFRKGGSIFPASNK